MSTNYADIAELKRNVYFLTATHDPRFVWEEIKPQAGIAPVNGNEWADGLARYRIVRCAHREADRDGALCTHCGEDVPDARVAASPEPAPRRKGRKS